MFRRDHFVTNTIGRLRGWSPARLSLMVEARSVEGPFYCEYQTRSGDLAEAEGQVRTYLQSQGEELVCVDASGPGRVPLPPNSATVRVSGRIFFDEDET